MAGPLQTRLSFIEFFLVLPVKEFCYLRTNDTTAAMWSHVLESYSRLAARKKSPTSFSFLYRGSSDSFCKHLMIDFYLLETHDGASITRIYPRVPGFIWMADIFMSCCDYIIDTGISLRLWETRRRKGKIITQP